MPIIFLTGLLSCFSFMVSYAQPVVKASVNKSEILIGEQFTLKVESEFNEEMYKIKPFNLPDSLPHFEIITRGKIDSFYSNTRLSGTRQQLILTSFDSGKWFVPSFTINFQPIKSDTLLTLFTGSVPVTVSFSVSDTTNQLRDIKPIRQVEATNNWWYWLGLAIGLIALLVFLLWLYRYWKKRNGAAIQSQSGLSPYDEALKELVNLQQYNLSSPVEIKIFHTRLAEILKQYLSRQQRINHLTKTTGDILIVLSAANINKETLFSVAASLRSGDAVKFAKYIPPVNESESCLQSIKKVLSDLHQTSTNKP